MNLDDNRADPAGRTSRFARLLYPRALAALLIGGAAYLLLQMLWGEDTAKSWQLYGGALGFGLLGILGWWLLASTDLQEAKATGRYGKAWLGLPFCMLGVIGMMPLLVIAVSTEARMRMDPHDRITARTADDLLVITFQEATAANTVNLTIDEVPVATSALEELPGTCTWSARNRVLSVRLKDIGVAAGEIQAIRINAINAEGVPHLRDAQGPRIPQQRVVVTK
jgi:hypothetical protein